MSANRGYDDAPAFSSISVITLRLDGHFDVREIPGPRNPSDVVLARLDTGPLLDAIVVSGCSGCAISGKVTALLNEGGGRLGGYTVYDTDSPISGSSCPSAGDPRRNRAVAVSDLNHDGWLDLAVTRCEAADTVLLLNDGAGSFSEGGHLNPDGIHPDAIAAGDLNGDGLNDLAVVYDGVAVSVHLNTGDARFPGPAVRIGAVVGRPYVFVADMNGDGTNDVVFGGRLASGAEPADVVVALGDGRGGFPVRLGTSFEVDLGNHGATLADLDGDGDADLVIVNDYAGTLRVLLNDGTGRLVPRPAITLPPGASPMEVAAGDTDADGDNDIVVSDPRASLVRLLTNDGGGTLTPTTSIPAGSGVFGVALPDVNNDGRPDLVFAQTAGLSQPEQSAVVRLNAGGTFDDPVSYLAGLGARRVLGAQLNRSGGPELIVTDESNGHVWVLDSGRATSGLFGDLDIDLVPDLLEPNLGLDPNDPDLDDDRIIDGLDPSLISDIIVPLPKSAFSTPGKQVTLLAELANAEHMIGKGTKPSALKMLLEAGSHFDGCVAGKAPDKDDWILDCGIQRKLRLPLVLIVSNLRGVPLPQEFLPPPQKQAY